MPPSLRPHRHAVTGRLKRQRGDTTRERSEEILAALYSGLNPHQFDVLRDTSRWKSLRVGRRGGKTRTKGAAIVECAEKYPGARIVYGTLTLKNAKKLMWEGKDGLKAWDRRLGLNLKYNNSDLVARWPNGSKCFLMGFETSADVDKVRGDNYRLFLLDECAFFPFDLFKELIAAIRPALADDKGSLIIGGSPGSVLEGEFFLATSSQGAEVVENADGTKRAACIPWERREAAEYADVNPDDSWSFHGWSVKDNTALPHLWDEAKAEQRRNGWTDNNPTWRREWLGEWAADNTALVYQYNRERNGWVPGRLDRAGPITKDNPHGLPVGHHWKFVCGMDFGSTDPTAISVLAYSDTHPAFFHVDDYKESHLTLRKTVKLYREWEERFGGFTSVVGDRGGGQSQFVDSMKEEGVPIEAAEKTDKDDFIDLFNGDLIDGRGFIREGSRLESEMKALVWDTRKQKRVEDKRAPNHVCDATLYAWRHAYHRFHRPAPKIIPGTPEAMRLAVLEEKRKACAPKPRGLDSGPRFRLDRPGLFR